MDHRYYVYILASRSRTLYIGVTRNLELRIRQHRNGTFDGFTCEYKIHRLVHYECFRWIQDAIAREKQLKRWRREKKLWLIGRGNPTWEDLSGSWGKPAKLTWKDPSTSAGQQVPPRGPARRDLGRDDTLRV